MVKLGWRGQLIEGRRFLGRARGCCWYKIQMKHQRQREGRSGGTSLEKEVRTGVKTCTFGVWPWGLHSGEPAAASCWAAQPRLGSAQLSSARLGSAAPGPRLGLSVEGFSRETRRFLRLWLYRTEAAMYEPTVQRQQERSSEMQKRQKRSREVLARSQPSAVAWA